METLTYDHERIKNLLDLAEMTWGAGPLTNTKLDRTVIISLMSGQTAWNPASTKTAIHGPTLLRYERHPDGGITLTIEGFGLEDE